MDPHNRIIDEQLEPGDSLDIIEHVYTNVLYVKLVGVLTQEGRSLSRFHIHVVNCTRVYHY